MYVFRKLNNLAGTGLDGNVAASGTPQGQAIDGAPAVSGDAGVAPTTTTNSPSGNVRNPTAIYDANKNLDMGGLETGTSKAIQDADNNMKQAGYDYSAQLKAIDDKNRYNSSDLGNVGDADTYSRLKSILDGTSEKASLANVRDTAGDQFVDASGLANASTVPGLTKELQKQYHTTAGGARLDALLYRNSGQAGKALNQDFDKLNSFQDEQKAAIDAGKKTLGLYNSGVDTRSSKLKSDINDYENNLMNAAYAAAAKDFTKYSGDQLGTLQKRNADAENAARAAIQQAIDDEMGKNGRSYITNRSDNDYQARQNILDALQGKVSFDSSKYATTPQFSEDMFDPHSYLDSRYNALASLIGGQQYAPSSHPDANFGFNDSAYNEASKQYADQQAQRARQLISEYMNGNLGVATKQTKY